MSIRILLVDDFQPWRLKIRSMAEQRRDWQFVGEASDGLEAVQKAAELRPDLILLDIGLPVLNGIEAARQILKFSPAPKILFVTQETSSGMARAALATGAMGYLSKMDAGRELFTAVDAVLRGELYVRIRIDNDELSSPPATGASQSARSETDSAKHANEIGRHKAGFYSDDRFLLDDLTQFAGAALKAGNTAIVIATESHLDSLRSRLQRQGVDMRAAIEQGRYSALDTANALLTFMTKYQLDPDRCLKLLSEAIETGLRHARGEPKRLAVFGECCAHIWTHGNAVAPVQMEKLGNQLVAMYNVDILCGYTLSSFEGQQSSATFRRICAEHSAIHLQ